ncbi:uncharacterized protein EAE97_011911 [Botrytis byssoidea]|uniref:Uncharacterized protein n=1 Tax=Botrytis byssoidea TaxID=139641 RepID=A0A9P5HSS1_9HELO|nr:uncharacterized protein EAE97_011911 [Botrytis byssoidea]KAF7918140.1 hypothetical protein EAE97_011911 [Botrytis byssoidea]
MMRGFENLRLPGKSEQLIQNTSATTKAKHLLVYQPWTRTSYYHMRASSGRCNTCFAGIDTSISKSTRTPRGLFKNCKMGRLPIDHNSKSFDDSQYYTFIKNSETWH